MKRVRGDVECTRAWQRTKQKAIDPLTGRLRATETETQSISARLPGLCLSTHRQSWKSTITGNQGNGQSGQRKTSPAIN